MDQGVIACLKQHYKKLFVCKMISSLDEGKEFQFSVLNGILRLNTAWKRVSQKTIVNCYRHAGFYHNVEFDEDDELPLTQWLLKYKNSVEPDDEDFLSLQDWDMRNNIIKVPLNE
ncbi:DDE superfamily endonuclease [Popillia japonica]|uniref:DDE superfamily endonuclease n=1 Tax=Popillia japonica TaxID=7064 RepID=A0AAW1JDW1_POPJA